MRRFAWIGILFWPVLFAGIPHVAPAEDPVVVVLDMDPARPGFQSSVDVPPGQGIVAGIGVYIFDPRGERILWDIGYLGGIDRGISFGHVPDPNNQGVVGRLVARAGAPVNPGNTPVIVTEPGIDKGFPGPEVQYVEGGAAEPVVIPGDPAQPVFTVDVVLNGGEEGDLFDFHLLDFVTVWTGGEGGSFSTRHPISLDSGGDAVADSTRTLYGVDPDPGIPVPPAAFSVDFIDGGEEPGPARIRVTAAAAVDPLRPAMPVAVHLRPADPNPFRGSTTIRYVVWAPGPIRIDVVDLTGRRIRTLVDPIAPEAGTYAVRWDGRDGRGHRLSSGIYFIRLEAEGLGVTQSAVLAR